MAAIPGDVDPSSGPPTRIPLLHFLVGLAFLVAGVVAGLAALATAVPATLAHVHLLLVGWVCVTILGAMTQFVPVWSGVPLHSRRLARLQLWLLAPGLAGFAELLLAGERALLAVPGALMVAGLWTFAYNVGRSLLRARPWDVTERHFAVGVASFALLAPLGLVLAAGYAVPLGLPVARSQVLAAHATLAVFGAVVATALGGLYQLATMFTQTELHGVDVHLRRFEAAAYPLGLAALVAGRLLGVAPLATLGGLLVAAGVGAVAVVVARKLRETRVPRTPMLTRYAVVAGAAAVWAPLAAAAWLRDPLDGGALFGPPAVGHLLLVGVVGFVVAGTLYHVVPFLVWVDVYSDRLGLEPVPSIDDLYDDRLAAADGWALGLGGLALVAAEAGALPPAARLAGGALWVAGAVAFAANLLLVVHRHRGCPAGRVLGGRLPGGRAGDDGSATGDD